MATKYRAFDYPETAEMWGWKVAHRFKRFTAGKCAVRPFRIEIETTPTPRAVVHVPDAWQAILNAWETAQLTASKPSGFSANAARERRTMVVGAYDIDRTEVTYETPTAVNVETLRSAIQSSIANGMFTTHQYPLNWIATAAGREAHLEMLQEEGFLCGIKVTSDLYDMGIADNYGYLADGGTTADGNDALQCLEAMYAIYCGHEVWEESADGITRAARLAQVEEIEATFSDVFGFMYPYSSDSGSVTSSGSRLLTKKNGSPNPTRWREPHVFLSQGPYGTVPTSAKADLEADRKIVDANCAGLRACLLNAMTSATSDNIRDALIDCDKAGFHLVLIRACDDAIAPANITADTLSGIAAYRAAIPTTPVP
jgi:hypothetical protein